MCFYKSNPGGFKQAKAVRWVVSDYLFFFLLNNFLLKSAVGLGL